MTMGLAAAMGAVVLAQSAAASYSEAKAIDYAKLAGAAYCSPEQLYNWSCGDNCIDGVSVKNICPGSGATRSYVAYREGKCLVGFQGSHTLQSWIVDLQLSKDPASWSGCENCHVHSGMLREYESHAQCVQSTLSEMSCSGIQVTGHSLGASTAMIAAVDLMNKGFPVEEVYTFGQPRTGDSNFAQAADQMLKGKYFRITHGRDPVPNLPPDQFIIDYGYEHAEPEAYYSGHVSEGFELCTEPHQNTKCIEQHWVLAVDLLHVGDHLNYMDVLTSTAGCAKVALNGTALLV